MTSLKRRNQRLIATGAYLGAVIGAVSTLHAQTTTTTTSDSGKISQLEKQNQDLQKRLRTLEDLATKNGLMPSGDKNADPPVSALTDFSISGFVTTSYFHDSSGPSAANGHIIPGYLWNRVNDNISLNKFKITLASPPVQQSGDKFDVGYRASLIAGQDAPIVNSGAKILGFDYLREAYLEVNIPIGTGLDVKAGELISLLNYESGDGGAANDNFSQGFQWFFTGNGPAAAAEVGYSFTDWLGVKARVQNGLYAGPVDNNSSKTFVGAIDLKPMTNLWVNLIGFTGREDAFSEYVEGGELLAGYQVLPQLGFGTELDYFDFYNHSGTLPANLAGNNSVYSGGIWASYWFSTQVGLGLRAEYLSDRHGADISAPALGLMNPPGIGQDITSVALTLNYKPLSRIKIQPEIRWDHTSWSHGWDPITPAEYSKQNRFIYGLGASYLF
jgi:hypothetical protein